MHNVCQEVVVAKPVLGVNLLVVDSKGSVQDAALLQGQGEESSHEYSRIPPPGGPGTLVQTHRGSSPQPTGPW